MTSRLKISSEIKHFDRDQKFRSRSNFFDRWALWDSYKQGLECWISGNHGNHRHDERHGNSGCKPRVPQTTGLEIPQPRLVLDGLHTSKNEFPERRKLANRFSEAETPYLVRHPLQPNASLVFTPCAKVSNTLQSQKENHEKYNCFFTKPQILGKEEKKTAQKHKEGGRHARIKIKTLGHRKTARKGRPGKHLTN